MVGSVLYSRSISTRHHTAITALRIHTQPKSQEYTIFILIHLASARGHIRIKIRRVNQTIRIIIYHFGLAGWLGIIIYMNSRVFVIFVKTTTALLFELFEYIRSSRCWFKINFFIIGCRIFIIHHHHSLYTHTSIHQTLAAHTSCHDFLQFYNDRSFTFRWITFYPTMHKCVHHYFIWSHSRKSSGFQ